MGQKHSVTTSSKKQQSMEGNCSLKKSSSAYSLSLSLPNQPKAVGPRRLSDLEAELNSGRSASPINALKVGSGLKTRNVLGSTSARVYGKIQDDSEFILNYEENSPATPIRNVSATLSNSSDSLSA